LLQSAEVTPLAAGRDAADRGDWHQACELLVQADAHAALGARDLELLARVAYAAGHVDVTIDAWERIHAGALRSGDRIAAANAAIRVALHLLFDTALLAPIRGWAARAERLLEGEADTAVHAWIGVVRGYERLLSGDFARAGEWARRAIDIGTRRDLTAAALGRVAEARSLILQGDVTRGLDLLNEAAVSSVSGEIDPLSTGVVYCEVVCALQAIAQYDLAEQWTQAMERWHQGHAVGSIHGRCRLHRAEILRLRGSCADAEREALRACEELRPYLRRELGWPLTELGRIRLRTGNLQGAERAFVEALEAAWDPQPGLALVRLAQGDVAAAATMIREALDHPLNVPSKELPPNTDLRRAPLLDAQIEIAVAAGDLETAGAAADELTRIAAAFDSAALSAGATVGRGRVRLAGGDVAGARQAFEAAAQQWTGIGAPYEAAIARTGLARALRAEGREALAILQFRAALSAFEELGARSQAALVEQAIAELPPPGLSPRLPADGPSGMGRQPVPANRLSREGEYWCVCFAGQTTRLRDSKGLRYVARLLADPGRELHVLDLAVTEHADAGDDQPLDRGAASALHSSDSGEILDARARGAYRRRLADIDDDIAEARQLHDTSRVEQAMAERDFLARELSRAVGLGGRDRRAGAASERARASVTRAIRHAMARIRTHHPVLADHLDRTIRTGTYCVYLPDPRVPAEWER
jgi:tetratricopeptide (TPR) repeat protein